jgi:hypothetical protein
LKAVVPKRLTVRRGEPFEITLSEPGATGYLYEPHFDPNFISYEGVNRTISRDVGGGSLAIFRFKTRTVGTSEICFRLTAPWDPEPADEKRVRLDIGA